MIVDLEVIPRSDDCGCSCLRSNGVREGTKSFLEATFGGLTITDHVALISLRSFQSDGQELESSSKPSLGNVSYREVTGCFGPSLPKSTTSLRFSTSVQSNGSWELKVCKSVASNGHAVSGRQVNRLFRSWWRLGFVSHYPSRPRHWIISTSVQSNVRELEFSNRRSDSSRFTTICCQVTGCFGLHDWVLSVITLIVRRLRSGRKGKTREREREGFEARNERRGIAWDGRKSRFCDP